MASKKPTPKVSRISRDRTVAYARKQKPGSSSADDDASPPDDDAPAEARSDGASATVAPHLDDAGTPPPPVRPASAMPGEVTAPMATLASAGPTAAGGSDDEPAGGRARIATVAMPIQASIGGPPAMPAEPAAVVPAIDPEVAEAPTRMPGPREIPAGYPDDPASPPGGVPPGDSRSMRRRTERYEFALIYRMQTYVICRFGAVGTRGQWRVVEYPTSGAAGHAYAKEVSRFVSEGFSDYRA
jgi:hypothetical protein